MPLGVAYTRVVRQCEGGAPPSSRSTCFTAPYDPNHIIPEVCYSDDRRLFASGDAALAHLIDVVCHGCWKAGAAVNGSKLRTFKVRLVGGKLQYIAGCVYPEVGPIQHCRGGLCLAGIPLVMGCRLHPARALPGLP